MGPPSTEALDHPGVMISSTYVDLKSLRKVLIDAAQAVGFFPEVMEHDGALPASVVQSSLQRVRRSSAYVLLIGHRYGQQPGRDRSPPDLRSITEMEFDEALACGLPTLLFILGDDYKVAKKHVDTDPEALARLHAFRERAKAMNGRDGVHRVYCVVNSQSELRRKAQSSMRALMDEVQKLRGGGANVPPQRGEPKRGNALVVRAEAPAAAVAPSGLSEAPAPVATVSAPSAVALPDTSAEPASSLRGALRPVKPSPDKFGEAPLPTATAAATRQAAGSKTKASGSRRSSPKIKSVADARLLLQTKKLLLLTANRHETQALAKVFAPGAAPTEIHDGEQVYSYYGLHGEHHVFGVVAASLGAQDAHSALNQAAADLDCKHIIAVGIAFGVFNDRQTLGQVLIANEILGYDLARVNPDGTEQFRDLPYRTSRYWLQRAQTRQHQPPEGIPAEHWPSAEDGTLLSGGKLIDNKALRDRLVSSFKNRIIGGEMEGVGVAAAATADPQKREWIVIKAICDFADGNKNAATKETDQQFAAWNAAVFVKSLIDPSGLGAIDWNARPQPPSTSHAPFPSSPAGALAPAAPGGASTASPIQDPGSTGLPPADGTTTAMLKHLRWALDLARAEVGAEVDRFLSAVDPSLQQPDDVLRHLQEKGSMPFLSAVDRAVERAYGGSASPRTVMAPSVRALAEALFWLGSERLVRERLVAYAASETGAALPVDSTLPLLSNVIAVLLMSESGVRCEAQGGDVRARSVIDDAPPAELGHLTVAQAHRVEVQAHVWKELHGMDPATIRHSYTGARPVLEDERDLINEYQRKFGVLPAVVVRAGVYDQATLGNLRQCLLEVGVQTISVTVEAAGSDTKVVDIIRTVSRRHQALHAKLEQACRPLTKV